MVITRKCDHRHKLSMDREEARGGGGVLQVGPGPQDTQGKVTWKRWGLGFRAWTGFYGVGDPVRVGGNETNLRDSGFAAANLKT